VRKLQKMLMVYCFATTCTYIHTVCSKMEPQRHFG